MASEETTSFIICWPRALYHVKELKKLGQQITEEEMGIKTFSFTAEYPDEDPDVTGTSVFFDAVIELAVWSWCSPGSRRITDASPPTSSSRSR